jgi:uncharacterized protein YkwD
MPHRRKTLAAGLAVIVTTGLMAAGPTGAATAPDAQRVSAPTKYARDAFRATNNRRERHDRREFRSNDCLKKYAVKNAKRMANREVMEHQRLGPIARDCRLDAVGENIADNYPTGRAVVRGWMNSPPHRANILSPTFKLMAVAARKGDNGHWYAAQVFGRKA